MTKRHVSSISHPSVVRYQDCYSVEHIFCFLFQIFSNTTPRIERSNNDTALRKGKFKWQGPGPNIACRTDNRCGIKVKEQRPRTGQKTQRTKARWTNDCRNLVDGEGRAQDRLSWRSLGEAYF